MHMIWKLTRFLWTDPKSSSRIRRLYERSVPCMHWRHECTWRHPQAWNGRTHCCWHPGTSLWHDHKKGLTLVLIWLNFAWVNVWLLVSLGSDHIKIFVLDEADEMLSRGFKDQIYDVFKTLNQNIQVCIHLIWLQLNDGVIDYRLFFCQRQCLLKF